MKKVLFALCATISAVALATDYYCRKNYTGLDDPNCFTVGSANGPIANEMPGPGDNLYFAEGDWYWMTESGTYPMYEGLSHIYVADGCTFALQPDFGSMKSTIPLVLTGATANLDNGMAGSGMEVPMDVGNISSAAGTELHLADCETLCTARNLTGNLSILSDGDWQLAGNQMFTGPITVNSGRLALTIPAAAKHQPFKYFRFTICQIGDEKWAGYDGTVGGVKVDDGWQGQGETTGIREFCLYDADGNRVTKDFFCNNVVEKNREEPGKCVTPVKNLEELEWGEVTFDSSMEGWVGTFDCDMNCMFDGDCNTITQFRFRKGWVHVRPASGIYWAFIMRMPEIDDEGNTPEITHFNFQWDGGDISKFETQTIRRFKLEGSPDGKSWATVWTNEKGKGDEFLWFYDQGKWTEAYGNYFWLADGTLSFSSEYLNTMEYNKSYAYNTTATDYVEELDNTEPFKWYRVSFANIGADNNPSRNQLNMRQFCLYDKNGTCISGDLNIIGDVPTFPDGANAQTTVTLVSYTNQYAELPKGCASWSKSMSGWLVYGDGCPGNPASLARLLETKNDYMTLLHFSSKDGNISPNPSNMGAHKWISFVMHLDDDVLPATHFNAQLGYTSTQDNVPTRIVIEGSVDGKEWTTAWSNLEGDLIDWKNHNDGWWNYPWLTGNDGLGAHCQGQPYSEIYPYNMYATGIEPEDDTIQAYKYFRFSIAEIDNGDGNVSMSLRNICLYNEYGTCVNWGLKMLNQNDDATIGDYEYVPEGYFAVDKSMAGCRYNGYENYPIGALMNDSWPLPSGEGTQNMCEMAFRRPDDVWMCPDPADPSTWIRFVMHIPEKSRAVTHFDFELGFISSDKNRPTKVVLEGSFDGETWKTIYSEVNKKSHVWPAGYYPWYSQPPTETGSDRLNQYVNTKAYAENYAYNVNSFEKVSQLGKIAYLNVMPEATFQGREDVPISTIGFSAEQGGYGTLKEVTLAKSGTIKVFDVSGDCILDLPKLDHCNGSFDGWKVDAGEGFIGTITKNGIEIVAGTPIPEKSGLILLFK